ncbi:MAG: transposase [Gallionellaceae bacterium]
MSKITKTLRLRVKDKHAKSLSKSAYEVNQVWNAANELSAEYAWVPIPGVGFVNLQTSEYDLNKELRPIREERHLSIGAATVQSVISQHAKSRKQFKKNKLNWRSSSGAKRALGWVPFKKAGIKLVKTKNGKNAIRFNGEVFEHWDSYDLSKYELGTGSFSEDARGRWYFNVTVKVEEKASSGTKSIGIDLGLKTVATGSDGTELNRRNITGEFAKVLAVAQRANKKQRVKAIHAKIKHSRQDALHKFTTSLVENYGAIFVGDVSSNKLVKTRLAKSVLDSGWGMLKDQLKYKAIARSVIYEEVNERNTTQRCSHCGVIPRSSPKGRVSLGIREWTCCECGVAHNRDVNAAKNILALGHERLAVGIPFPLGGEGCQ